MQRLSPLNALSSCRRQRKELRQELLFLNRLVIFDVITKNFEMALGC